MANLRRLYRLAGIPMVTFCGALGSALGTFGWAVAATPWQLAIAALVSGASWAALGAAAINALIEPWFVVRRPAALGMAYNGASVGGIVFSPLWALLIQAWGFAWAAGVVGASMVLVIAVLASLVFTRTPANTGQAPDGEAVAPRPAANPAPPARPAGRLREDRRFVTLAAAMSLGLFAQMGLVAHLYSLLVPTLGPGTAGLAMGAATGCAIAGRTIVGRIAGAGSDRRLLASHAYAIQALGPCFCWRPATRRPWSGWACCCSARVSATPPRCRR
ncbi:membrane protein [Bordetella pertussis]|nr:membrane protein [Bordetella pertussis]